MQIHVDNQSIPELSGVVRARFETPVAFQLDARMASRYINAGQYVEEGQVLSLLGLIPRCLLRGFIHLRDLKGRKNDKNNFLACCISNDFWL